MVAIFDPNIFYKGAQLQQANRDRLNNTFSNIMNMYMQNQQRKDAELKQQKQEAMKPENIGVMKMQGLPTSPEQDAVYDFWQAERLSQQAIDPTTGAMYSRYRPIESASQQGASQVLYPDSSPVPTPTMGGMQQSRMSNILFPDVAGDGAYNINEDRAVSAPQVEMPDTTGMSPKTKQIAEEETTKTRLQQQVDFAKKQMETEKGQNKMKSLLVRLQELNEELKEEGALQTQEGGVSNIRAMAAGVPFVGGAVESTLTPKAKKLRSEYEGVISSILPYYIAAENLPATVVDTEGFQQRIMDSFGNPYGMYETNKALVEGALGRYGGNKNQDIGSDPLGLFE